MKVVILCGGRGTRISDVSDSIPKPLIPIGNYPILWHIMKHYASWDYKDFVLCLGYKGQAIKNFFVDYEAHTRDFTVNLGKHTLEYHSEHGETDWRVTLADTGLRSMTGARIRRIHKYVKGESDFMLTYGDGVGNVDLDALLKFHRSHGKVLTVTGVRPPGRFGELMATPEGLATEFNEKPQAVGGRISGGFFVANASLFDYIEDGDDEVFEEGPLRRLVAERQLMVYEHNGFWQPMDTSREYELLNKLYESGKPPWTR